MIQTFGNYINGEWVTEGDTFENRNPANTDEIVGLMAKGSAADIERAAEAADAAFPEVVGDAGTGAWKLLIQSGRPARPTVRTASRPT